MKLSKLNRFTTLPVLLDLLTRKRLVLLDPASWDDKNDSHILLEYKKKRGIKSLCALCFSHGDETIHHWKTFADGISGCCIQFHAEKLLTCFESSPGIRHGPVRYRKLSGVDASSIAISQIPFTKRWPYRCEEEFRIIREGSDNAGFFEVDVDLRSIHKITISQRMPAQVYSTIRDLLRTEFKNPDQRISRSTLYQNDVWINRFKLACSSKPPFKFRRRSAP